MANFRDLNSLFNYIQRDVDLTLVNEVYKDVKSRMIKNIDDHVYGVYNPVRYKRRRSRGGLSDRRNIRIVEQRRGSVTIRNTRTDGNQDVAYNVEYGKNHYMSGGGEMFPRPFTRMTREELKNTKAPQNAISEGLRRRGYNVR